jgi:dTDP-glucose 4,6-dehydratase
MHADRNGNHLRVNVFTISQPMKYMEAWEMRVCLLKIPPMILKVHILLQKPVQITLSEPISNCSNNYGPNQFPEKLIPLSINNIKQNKSIPIYGKGENIRDWLYVEDHAQAIDTIYHNGSTGETYNIGGNNEWTNIDLIRLLCEVMDRKLGREAGTSAQLITFVSDRAGHDMRYAIDSSKISKDLKWDPSVTFETGLEKTVGWYLENSDWLENVTSGAYASYYKKQYSR